MFITGEATVELGEAGGLLQVVAGVVVLGALDADTALSKAIIPARDRVHVSAQQLVVFPGLGNALQL